MIQTNKVFIDTAGWANLINPNEDFHSLATKIYAGAIQQGVRLITTNYVIAELVAVLTSPIRVPKPTIIAAVAGLKSSSKIQIVHIDQAQDDEAWDLLSRRPDKLWSLVDCASFVVMQELGITEALTTDHHFEQAGFIRLLKLQS
jgi:predicted nucleic acid-binding protein